MSTTEENPQPAPVLDVRRRSESRMLFGYGPLIGWITAFLVMILLAPTVAPERIVTSRSGGTQAQQQGDETAVTSLGSSTAGSATGPGVTTCPGPQISGDPYSPPCRAWNGGNNGGATAKGVTKDTITLAWRDSGGPYDIGSTVSSLTGKRINTGNATRDDLIRTYTTLIDYFNKHFQFYGRKLQLKVYRATGSPTDELLGGGQSGANADAIIESQQINAFADLGAQAPPFADALAHQGVIATNPIYPSLNAFKANAPYNWGLTPDCDKVAEYGSDFVLKEIIDNPVLAGQYKGQKRKLGLVYPESPAYSPCADHAREIFKAAGRAFPEARTYRLSLDGIPPDSRDIAAAFANDGITTVLLFTDPLTPYFMTATAEQSNWHPEWIEMGVAFLDTDFAGQLYEPDQWKNSFGVSLNGETLPSRSTYGYAAYRSMDSSTSPVDLAVDLMYYNLYLVAIGVQMAGPNLTPQTFAQGMHAYKEASDDGAAGAWAFPDGQYTAPVDGRVVWWDPTAVSNYNGQPGAYKDNGKRYPLGQVPAGPPDVHVGQ
ncbi:MAG TPA: hypothetical protein VHD87_17920 [Acidimicrobiales bacterium]|nr:hypothetical protein [Acidimicrobiales bacterium]